MNFSDTRLLPRISKKIALHAPTDMPIVVGVLGRPGLGLSLTNDEFQESFSSLLQRFHLLLTCWNVENED